MIDPIPYAKARVGERRWYLREEKALYGPLTIEEINEMTERGLIGKNAIVFKESRWFGAKERFMQREIRFTVRQLIEWGLIALFVGAGWIGILWTIIRRVMEN